MDYRKEFKCHCCCYPDNWDYDNSNDNCDKTDSEHYDCEKRWGQFNKYSNCQREHYSSNNSKEYYDDNNSRGCRCKQDIKHDDDDENRRNGRRRCCFCRLFKFY